MAEAIARKSFPASGNYSSAGANPAAELDQSVVRFLADLGVDISEASPREVNFTEHELAEFHLVVSLQGPVSDYLSQLPFHTSGMEWDVGETARGQHPGDEQLKTVYRELSSQISEMMQMLRGEDAQ